MPKEQLVHMRIIYLAVLLSVSCFDCEGASFSEQVRGENVAAVVYAQNASATPMLKHAQSRLENMLLDNGITVLDRAKAEALRTAAPALEDPGAFVTAEWFVENAGKFEIKGLLAIYLSADAAPGLADYYTATAHADIRFISEQDAQVRAVTTSPMGAPGSPPSDGLTRSSALINAIQRAIDNAGAQMGMELMDPARPRSVKLGLEGPLNVSIASALLPDGNLKALAKLATLDSESWRKEAATAAARAPAGQLAAVGGYIVDTDFHRRPPRVFGSRVHLIDLSVGRELMVLDCHPVGKKDSGEKGSRKVLDCAFIKSWRFLAAVSGSSLFFWDTERGQLMTKVNLPRGLKSAQLCVGQDESGSSYLVVVEKKRQYVFRIVRGS
jgi:hypothetical protein